MNKEDIKKSIDNVLDYSEYITETIVLGDSIDLSKMHSIRKDCEIITEAGLYLFDVNLDNRALIDQIKDFADSY